MSTVPQMSAAGSPCRASSGYQRFPAARVVQSTSMPAAQLEAPSCSPVGFAVRFEIARRDLAELSTQPGSWDSNTSLKMALALSGSAAAETEQSAAPGATTSHQIPSTMSTRAQPLTAPTPTW